MRPKLHSWVFGLAMMAASCLFAHGQGPGVAPPPPPDAPQRRSMEALSELHWLTQQLKLTPEQAAKVRPIVTDEGEQMHLVKVDERLPLEQKRAKMLEIREAFRPKIAAVLTPEQQEKWKQLQPPAQGKAPEGAKDPGPPPNK
jgi:Spy/CpxP family protein refolding chaperone